MIHYITLQVVVSTWFIAFHYLMFHAQYSSVSVSPIDGLILCINVAYTPVATTRYSNLCTSQVSSAFFEQ